jgi:SAM-dependent methyltransferase
LTFDYAAQPKEPVKACNLCGWQHFEPFAGKDRYGLPVKSVACSGCGLVFLAPRMTARAYSEFYFKGNYRELLREKFGKPYTAESIESDQRKYALWLLTWLEPHLLRGGRKEMLDVGGSTGVVASLLAQRFGLKATIMDPSEPEGVRALAKGLLWIPSSVEEYEPDGHKWDVVLMCQTIDHLLDITKALRTLRAVINPKGRLFIDLSDYRQVLTYMGGDRTRVVKLDHPYYLTPMHLGTYLNRAGFRVIDRFTGQSAYQYAMVCEPKANG